MKLDLNLVSPTQNQNFAWAGSGVMAGAMNLAQRIHTLQAMQAGELPVWILQYQ